MKSVVYSRLKSCQGDMVTECGFLRDALTFFGMEVCEALSVFGVKGVLCRQ